MFRFRVLLPSLFAFGCFGLAVPAVCGAGSFHVGPIANGCPIATIAEAIAAAHANGTEADTIYLSPGFTFSVAGPLVLDLEVAGDVVLTGRYYCTGGSSPAQGTLEFSSGAGLVVDGGTGSQRTFTIRDLLVRPAPGSSGVGRMLDLSGNVRALAHYLTLQGGDEAEGGVLRVTGPGAVFEPLVQEVWILDGTATGDGGGILIDGGHLDADNGSLTVSGNVAGGRGGGIACRGGGGITISFGELSDNDAELGGGGIALDDCTLTAVKTLIADNGTGVAGEGGGLYAAGGATAVLVGSLFQTSIPGVVPSIQGNTAGTGGGAFATGSGTSVELRQTQLLNNVAAAGGAVAVEQGASLQVFESWITANTAVDGSAGWASAGSLLFESVFLSGQNGGSLVRVESGGEATAALVTSVANDLDGAAAFALAGTGSSVEIATSVVADGLVFDPPSAGTVRSANCVAAVSLSNFPAEPRAGAYYLAGSAAQVLAYPDGSAPDLLPGGAAVDFCDGAPWLPTTLDLDGQTRPYDMPPAGSIRFGNLDLGADESRGLFFADHEEGNCSDWTGTPACP